MRHAPPPSEDDSLGVPVERPKSPFRNGAHICRKTVVLNESFGRWINHPSKLVNDDSAENIPEDIEERFKGVPFVEVLRHN